MANHRLLTALIAGAIIASLAACGGGKHAVASGTFNDQGNQVLSCMTHQTASPVTADRAGPAGDPSRVLTYLHYYTVNGNKPYCDGKPATAADRQWLALYLAGGATRSHISRALARG
jgi:hypothetical protein